MYRKRSLHTEIMRVSTSSVTIEITFLNIDSPYKPAIYFEFILIIYPKDSKSRYIEKSALTYLMG